MFESKFKGIYIYYRINDLCFGMQGLRFGEFLVYVYGTVESNFNMYCLEASLTRVSGQGLLFKVLGTAVLAIMVPGFVFMRRVLLGFPGMSSNYALRVTQMSCVISMGVYPSFCASTVSKADV